MRKSLSISLALLLSLPALAQAACDVTLDTDTLTGTSLGTALSNATAGQTICLDAGTATFTTTASATIAANVTLQGQTVCTGSGQTVSCTDNTTLINNVTGGSGKLFGFTNSTTGVFRITGITFQSQVCTDNVLSMGVGSGYATLRLDHNHWYNVCNFNMNSSNSRGVADHNLFENPTGPAGANQVRAFGIDTDTEWTQATNFGTNTYNWFYFEDNKWVRGIANDCYSSGRQAFRYNYIDNAGIQQHGTGHSGQNRGCRAMEVYGNTINGGTANRTTAVAIYTGSARVFDNVIDFSGGGTMMQLTETRQSAYTYNPGAMPTKWGPCGSSYDGTGSVWDGNTDATGYPCLDQVGRGAGDLLSGDFSTKRNNTRNCTVNFTWANRGSNCDNSDSSAWPSQALEPVYEWNNSGSTSGGWINVYRSPASDPNIVEDRDFYTSHNNTACDPGAGACTAGVGSGTRAQRPSSCTTGVAYWSTDQGGNWNTVSGGANDGCLDICTATDTWTACSYTPLEYPHPIIPDESDTSGRLAIFLRFALMAVGISLLGGIYARSIRIANRRSRGRVGAATGSATGG